MSANFFDFNTAERPKFDLIPANTVSHLHMTLRPGGAGEGGWLKESQSGNLMMDCEFQIVDGEYAGRKVWQYMVVEGSEKAADITRSTLRSILESARNIDPKDESEEGQRKRVVKSYNDFDGLRFWAKIAIEKSKDPQYADKNKLGEVVTPDKPGYGQSAPASTHPTPVPAAPQPSASAPSWAR